MIFPHLLSALSWFGQFQVSAFVYSWSFLRKDCALNSTSSHPSQVGATFSVWFEFLGRFYSFRVIVVPPGCSDPPSVHQTHIPSIKEFLPSPPTNTLNLWSHRLEGTQLHWSLWCSLHVFQNYFFWLQILNPQIRKPITHMVNPFTKTVDWF